MKVVVASTRPRAEELTSAEAERMLEKLHQDYDVLLHKHYHEFDLDGGEVAMARLDYRDHDEHTTVPRGDVPRPRCPWPDHQWEQRSDPRCTQCFCLRRHLIEEARQVLGLPTEQARRRLPTRPTRRRSSDPRHDAEYLARYHQALIDHIGELEHALVLLGMER